MSEKYFCVDIGGTKTAFAVYDQSGKEYFYSVFPTLPEQGAYRLVDRVYNDSMSAINTYKPVCGSIAAPGPLNAEKGVLIDLVTLGWKNVEIVKIFQERFGFSFRLMNDCDAGALGVWKYGGYADYQNLAYVSLSTGVGGGVVLNGKPYFGAGNAADFGHMPVVGEGLRCGCGKTDCLELYASGMGMEKRYKSATGESIPCAEIVARAKQGEEIARRIFAQASEYLAFCVRGIRSTFDPDVIVFGGSVCAAGKLIFSALERDGVQFFLSGGDGKQVLKGALANIFLK